MSTTPSWTAAAIPAQTGRVAVVTGANSGIGFETDQSPRRERCRGRHGVPQPAKS